MGQETEDLCGSSGRRVHAVSLKAVKCRMGKALSAFSGQVEKQSDIERRVAHARSFSRPVVSAEMLEASRTPEARYERSVSVSAFWNSPAGARQALVARASLAVVRHSAKGIPLSDDQREQLRSYMLKGGSARALQARYGAGAQARNEQMARDFWLKKFPAEELAKTHGLKVRTVLQIVATTALKP